MLDNEQVRELVMIQALKESYYDAHYNRPSVKRMLQSIAQKSKFPEHRKLAKAIINSEYSEYSEYSESSEKPFCLPNAEKETVCLDDFRGKWVYIAFVRVNDPNCLKEIETMAHFRDSLRVKNPDVELVGISCDREFQKMYHFLKNSKRDSKYNWTWLHFNGNYRLLEHYQVVSYPHFILINPEGQLQYAITPQPASGFLMHGPWQTKEQQEAEKPFFLRY
jgi:cytochrome oxidase Cu insertion factor (SCO1/SenC/PrrC family)